MLKMYSDNPKLAMNVKQRNRKAERINRKQIIRW